MRWRLQVTTATIISTFDRSRTWAVDLTSLGARLLGCKGKQGWQGEWSACDEDGCEVFPHSYVTVSFSFYFPSIWHKILYFARFYYDGTTRHWQGWTGTMTRGNKKPSNDDEGCFMSLQVCFFCPLLFSFTNNLLNRFHHLCMIQHQTTTQHDSRTTRWWHGRIATTNNRQQRARDTLGASQLLQPGKAKTPWTKLDGFNGTFLRGQCDWFFCLQL